MLIQKKEKKLPLEYPKIYSDNNGVEHNSRMKISTYCYGSKGRKWLYLSYLNNET